MTVNNEIEHLKFSSSYKDKIPFKYSSSNESYLTKLRQRFQLGTLIISSESDIERVNAICQWVHNLWVHDGSNSPQKYDPISIIEEAQNGNNFRCIEYAIVLHGCLAALDITSRIVVLMVKDIESKMKGIWHYVVEAFLTDYQKWCMIDGQWNAIPVLRRAPLTAIEFQAALANQEKDLEVLNQSELSMPTYFRWIGPFLYYFQYNIDNRIGVNDRSKEKIMLVPTGAKKPKFFKFPIGNLPMRYVTYSNSLLNIYKPPES